MNRFRLITLVAFLVVAGTILSQGARAVSRQTTRSRELADRIGKLTSDLALAQREDQAIARELALAETQLANAPGSPDATIGPADHDRDVEVAAWLARVKRLKQHFAQHPDQQIPELRTLTDKWWLSVGSRFDLDNEDNLRPALASVRNEAKSQFLASLAKSIWPYVRAHSGIFPATTSELAPYLRNPADAEALSRYEIVPAAPPLNFSNWVAREKSAVDADYDSRYSLEADGTLSAELAPTAWIPEISERQKRARRAFAAANPGGPSPDGLIPLIPFFDPPLDPASVEKLVKAERARHE
jgi:hypothetical protein